MSKVRSLEEATRAGDVYLGLTLPCVNLGGYTTYGVVIEINEQGIKLRSVSVDGATLVCTCKFVDCPNAAKFVVVFYPQVDNTYWFKIS